MCTVSFLRLSQGYSLMMNRDEARERPLSAEMRRGPSALWPLDPLSQGTWIGANAAGCAFALMNAYPAGWTPRAGLESRGRLVPLALQAASAGGGLERVAALDLARTAPFTLLGVEPGHAPLSLAWDGRALQRRLHADGALMLTVSSYEPRTVEPLRQAAFERCLAGLRDADEPTVLAGQEAFHLSQEPAPGPEAVWMTRADAWTVSLTQVLALPAQVLVRHGLRTALEAGQSLVLEALKRN